MIVGGKNVSLDYIALVAYAASTPVGLQLVGRRADDEDEVILTDGHVHKGRQLISRSRMPLIESYLHPIRTETHSQIPDPGFVRSVIPRIRYECLGHKLSTYHSFSVIGVPFREVQSRTWRLPGSPFSSAKKF